jgi:glycosyltransferase involved in cell wall biosynthesis
LKILHLNAAYKPAYVYGGPTMSVAMLCEYLAAAGHEITVFTTTANGPTELPLSEDGVLIDHVTVFRFKRVTFDHTHFSPGLLRRLWREARGFDIVHVHAWWNLVSVLGCLVALIRGVPVVVSPRGTLSAYSFATHNKVVKRLIHLLLGKPLLQKCHIHATSEQERAAVKKLIKPTRVFVLANLVSLPAYTIRQAVPAGGALRLIFFSRIDAKKGLDILFRALARVTIPYSLTVAGNGDPGYIAGLQQLATGLAIAGNLTWAGFQSEDKFRLLSTHDLFVLPSRDENFANTIIESLAVGTPVLISDRIGLKDYIQANQLGWICGATVSALAAAINAIGTDHLQALAAIRQMAPPLIYRDFAPEQLVRQYIQQYTQIVDHG